MRRRKRNVPSLNNKCFYVLNPGVIQISLGLKFEDGEDDFEDVIFSVTCDDEAKAIRRVKKFVKMLIFEFGGRK